MEEQVILVDLEDNELGLMEKQEAHQKALLHRAVSVFIFNTDGKLLLQQRALCKYHSPALWTNTACTHPRQNESNKDAAVRRLEEEMGIYEPKLMKLFDFVYKEKFDNELTEYEFDHVFVGLSNQKPKPNSDEVASFEYVSPKELLEQIQQNPENYTVWFKKIIERVLNEYKNQNN